MRLIAKQTAVDWGKNPVDQRRGMGEARQVVRRRIQ